MSDVLAKLECGCVVWAEGEVMHARACCPGHEPALTDAVADVTRRLSIPLELREDADTVTGPEETP